MEMCKVPTPWLKVLNKHNMRTMYTEMENVIPNPSHMSIYIYIYICMV